MPGPRVAERGRPAPPDSGPTTVLIVGDGWQRGTLAATRSLSAAGHAVHLAGPNRGHAARSRHCAGWHRLPRAGEPGFGEQLRRVVAATGAAVVFAGDDEHLLALVAERDLGPGVTVGHPDRETVTRALDKRSLYAAAELAGVPVPEVRRVPPPGEDAEWIAKRPLYTSGVDHEHVLAEELDLEPGPARSSAAQAPVAAGWLFQKVVPGELLAVVALCDRDGRALHLGAQVAETVYPAPFGVSARARAVPLPEPMADGVRRLLADLGWWGLAELQFQVDEDGEPHLIDFNGRFFGSLALTVGAGVDLPKAWLALCRGDRVDPADLVPRRHARYQWLEGDLRRALASDRPVSDTLTALGKAPRSVHSVWSVRDAGPALLHAGELVGWASRRAVRRIGRSSG